MDNKYTRMTDEMLVSLARSGNADAEEYLIRKFKDTVRRKARVCFIAGADNEDIVQEGMIGIFKAIKAYDETKDASFNTFAEICITGQIRTAIKTAKRYKHAPLNDSLPLEAGVSKDNYPDPETLYILKEEINDIKSGSVFSEMELIVWNEYIKGHTHYEIAQITGKTPKAVDNAIWRAKRKLKEDRYARIGV